MTLVGSYEVDIAEYAQRGAEARQDGKALMTRAEKTEKTRKRRTLTLAELRVNKVPAFRAASSGHSDLFVVRRDDLVALIKPWVERQSREAEGSGLCVGGMMYLASEIGSHPDLIRNLFRLETPWIAFGLADDLLVTLNSHMAFHDGRVPVYVNPRIPYKRWCERAKDQDVDCPAEVWLLHSHPEAWAA